MEWILWICGSLLLVIYIIAFFWSIKRWPESGKIIIALITSLGLIVAAIVPTVTWYLNNQEGLKDKYYQRKEELYGKIIKGLGGLDDKNPDTLKADLFLESFNLCWLYSPDTILKTGYAFINCQKGNAGCSQSQKKKLAGDLISMFRQDLINRKYLKQTRMKPTQFQFLHINKDSLMASDKEDDN